jgi:hypothetical protein
MCVASLAAEAEDRFQDTEHACSSLYLQCGKLVFFKTIQHITVVY